MPTLSDSTRQFLEARHYAVLATHNDDGSIHTTPIWYLFEDGTFYVGSPSSSRKAQNVAARLSATIMVDVRQPGGERWVYASGRVATLKDAASREVNSRILRRYLTEEAIQDPRIGPAFAAADDMTICLFPQTWRFWNSKDVDDQFFGGVLSSSPEKWFLPVDN